MPCCSDKVVTRKGQRRASSPAMVLVLDNSNLLHHKEVKVSAIWWWGKFGYCFCDQVVNPVTFFWQSLQRWLLTVNILLCCNECYLHLAQHGGILLCDWYGVWCCCHRLWHHQVFANIQWPCECFIHLMIVVFWDGGNPIRCSKKCPKGVMKVVSSWLCSSMGHWW